MRSYEEREFVANVKLAGHVAEQVLLPTLVEQYKKEVITANERVLKLEKLMEDIKRDLEILRAATHVLTGARLRDVMEG